MRAALLTGGLALVAGAAAGLSAGAWFMHAYAPKQAQVEVRSGGERGSSTQPSMALLAKAINENKAHSAELATQEQTSSEPSVSKPRRFPLSLEERRARWKESYRRRLERVQTEPRDPVWASATEKLFRDDFGARAEKFQAEVLGVECMTTGCLVRVRWDSYTKAKARFRDVVHESFSTNCATTMDLGSQPPNPDAPHQALVIFECEQGRLESLGARD